MSAVAARDAARPDAMTQLVLDLVGVEAGRPRDVGHDARIEVAGAGAHDDAADRRQAHAGVDRAAVAHGCKARTVAQVRKNDLLPPPPVTCPSLQLVEQERVRQAMEAVASDSLCGITFRHRQAAGHLRKIGMKRGVEADDLRRPRVSPLDRFDQVEFVRQVVRRESHQLPQ